MANVPISAFPAITTLDGTEMFPVVDGVGNKKIIADNILAWAIAAGNIVIESGLPYVTPEQFGAVGNGVTDDTQAVNDAIDACTAGGTVKFTKTYRLNCTTSDTAAITLTSAHDSITLEGPGTIIADSANSSYFYMFKLTNCKKITVKDLRIDGNTDDSWSTGGDNPVNGNARHAFLVDSVNDYDVTDIMFTGCTFRGFYDGVIHTINDPLTVAPITSRVRVENCLFEECGAHGVGFNWVEDSIVTGCTFKNVGKKILVGGYGSGMAVDCSSGCKNIVVANNVVDGAAAGFKCETHLHVTTLYPSYNIIIANNTIRNLYIGNPYNAATTYDAGQVVESGGILYISVVGSNLNHTPASSPTYWITYPVQAYSIVEIYSQDDYVSYSGKLYKSLQNANEGNQPDSSPTYWEDIASIEVDYTIWYGIKLSGINCSAIGNNIDSYATGILVDNKAQSCIVSDNHILATTAASRNYGIYLEYNANGGHVVTGNEIANTTGEGIRCCTPLTTVKNNRLKNCFSFGIHVLDGGTAGYHVADVVISGNIVQDTTTSGKGIGISRNGSSSNTIKRVNINGNVCCDTRQGASRTQSYGLYIDTIANGVEDVTEYGNDCYNNIASDYFVQETNRGFKYQGRKITNSDAVPTTGTWTRGDIVYRTNPGLAYMLGWVCVTSGTFSAYSDATGDTESGSNIITGMADTSGLSVGEYVTISAGFASSVLPYRVTAINSATSIKVDTNATGTNSNVTIATVDPVFSVMQGLVSTGTTAPSSTPTHIDQRFVNTTAKIPYFANAISSSSDWQELVTATAVQSLTNKKFGGASHYSSFEADGTLVFTGDATVYQDIDAAIIPKATGVGNPTLGTFTTNTQAWKFALNDTCHIDARELQHYWKEGSQIEFHVHWATNGANDATVRSVKWEIYLAWANAEPAGGTVVFAETTITQATATTVANAEASLTHKYSSVGTYTPTGGKIGGYLVVTLKRIAGGGTEPANDPFVLGCGVHVQCDTVGSRATAAK